MANEYVSENNSCLACYYLSPDFTKVMETIQMLSCFMVVTMVTTDRRPTDREQTPVCSFTELMNNAEHMMCNYNVIYNT